MSDDEILKTTVNSVKFETYDAGQFVSPSNPFLFGGGSNTTQSILEMHKKINDETTKIVD